MLHQRLLHPARRPRIAIVTNMPSPYRISVFAALPALTGADVYCLYLTRNEGNRDLQLETRSDVVQTHFPPSRELQVGYRYIHFTTGMPALLARIAPDVIVTTSYSQPYLAAFVHAWRHGIPHVAMTYGTDTSEQTLMWIHRQVRRAVFARTAAFVGPSLGSRRLYASYGIAPEAIFQSHLCADMSRFQAVDQTAAAAAAGSAGRPISSSAGGCTRSRTPASRWRWRLVWHAASAGGYRWSSWAKGRCGMTAGAGDRPVGSGRRAVPPAFSTRRPCPRPTDKARSSCFRRAGTPGVWWPTRSARWAAGVGDPRGRLRAASQRHSALPWTATQPRHTASR